MLRDHKRYVEKRNEENVIPLRNAVCGIDMPRWELHTANDNEMFLSGEAVDKLAKVEDKLENGILVELPKKCYQVIYLLGWEILEYDIIRINYSHTEGIISVDATRPNTAEYFTKDTKYKGRVLGVDVFFSRAKAKARLEQIKKER